MSNDKILYFLGSGNMAGAIGRGLAKRGTPLRLGFYDITYAKAEALAEAVGGTAARTLAEAAQADVLLLAVKPQNMAELLADLAPLLRPGQLILTIAAGLPLAWYEQRIPVDGLALVRAMPNTSAAVGAAITGLMAGRGASAEDRNLAEQVFAAVGDYLWLDESEIHALTALSGSGPAYYYYFTEALAAAGEALGLKPQTAQVLARQTAVGVGRLLEDRTDVPLAELRRQVTSKGGTTEAALRVFAADDALPQLVAQACRACAARSEEMANSN